MPLVPRDDIGEGSDRHRMTVGDPAPEPVVAVQAAEEEEVRPADELELLREAGQRPRVESGVLDVGVLVEAGERGRIVRAKRRARTPKIRSQSMRCPTTSLMLQV